MSNANIKRRIESLLGSLMSGEASLRKFASEFPAHFEALEKMDYSSINDAQLACDEFKLNGDMAADGIGDYDQMVAEAIEWVQTWLKSVTL
jgi:hypothetical protein